MTDDRENPQWTPDEIAAFQKEWGDRPPFPLQGMTERPSPKDLANKSEREAAYWREEERAAIVAWICGQSLHHTRTLDREMVMIGSAYDDLAAAIVRGDHLVRENNTPETDTPKVGE